MRSGRTPTALSIGGDSENSNSEELDNVAGDLKFDKSYSSRWRSKRISPKNGNKTTLNTARTSLLMSMSLPELCSPMARNPETKRKEIMSPLRSFTPKEVSRHINIFKDQAKSKQTSRKQFERHALHTESFSTIDSVRGINTRRKTLRKRFNLVNLGSNAKRKEIEQQSLTELRRLQLSMVLEQRKKTSGPNIQRRYEQKLRKNRDVVEQQAVAEVPGEDLDHEEKALKELDAVKYRMLEIGRMALHSMTMPPTYVPPQVKLDFTAAELLKPRELEQHQAKQTHTQRARVEHVDALFKTIAEEKAVEESKESRRKRNWQLRQKVIDEHKEKRKRETRYKMKKAVLAFSTAVRLQKQAREGKPVREAQQRTAAKQQLVNSRAQQREQERKQRNTDAVIAFTKRTLDYLQPPPKEEGEGNADSSTDEDDEQRQARKASKRALLETFKELERKRKRLRRGQLTVRIGRVTDFQVHQEIGRPCFAVQLLGASSGHAGKVLTYFTNVFKQGGSDPRNKAVARGIFTEDDGHTGLHVLQSFTFPIQDANIQQLRISLCSKPTEDQLRVPSQSNSAPSDTSPTNQSNQPASNSGLPKSMVGQNNRNAPQGSSQHASQSNPFPYTHLPAMQGDVNFTLNEIRNFRLGQLSDWICCNHSVKLAFLGEDYEELEKHGEDNSLMAIIRRLPKSERPGQTPGVGGAKVTLKNGRMVHPDFPDGPFAEQFRGKMELSLSLIPEPEDEDDENASDHYDVANGGAVRGLKVADVLSVYANESVKPTLGLLGS